MKVLVLGATGQTGRAVVEQAVDMGHEVTAFVRNDGYNVPGVSVRIGDATDAQAIASAVAGQDAVINTVGGKTPYKQTTLETDVATALVSAMKQHAVRRLVVTSSLGVGDSIKQSPLMVKAVVATFLRGSTRDKEGMETVVRDSGLDWIITRPAVLTNKSAEGDVRVLAAGQSGKASGVTRADVAGFLLAQLTADDHLRATVTVAGH